MDANFASWGKVYGSEEPYTYQTLWLTRIHSRTLLETSKKLIAVVRHYGCTDPDIGLGCDSGGWFKMTSLVADLVSRRPPKWARQLRRMLGMEMTVELDRQLQNGWERLIVQALPASVSYTHLTLPTIYSV